MRGLARVIEQAMPRMHHGEFLLTIPKHAQSPRARARRAAGTIETVLWVSHASQIIMKKGLFVLALLLTPLIAPAEETLADVLRRVNNEYRLPGMAAVAFRREAILEEAFTGVRCMGKPDAITIHDSFHLGSVTKSMTCSVAALLIEKKLLTWEDSVGKLLGKAFPEIHADYRAVTLRQLCEHRGGMATEINEDLWKELWQRTRRLEDAAAIRRWYVGELLKRPPAQQIGTYAYSNNGYMTVGLMLEVVTGKKWDALMREHLFEPLGMRRSGFGAPARADNPMAQPWPHFDGKPIEPGIDADNPPALGPAGTVHASIGDFARYGRWHLRAGHLKGGPALPVAAFAQMHRSRHFIEGEGGYALGWSELPRSWAKGNAITHSGSNNWNFAVIWIAQNADLGIVIVANEGQRSVAKALDDVAAWVVRKYADKRL